MSDKQTFTRDEFLTDVRGANGTRAQWFALMLEEAEKHGIDPDEFCEDTIYKFGLGRGKNTASARATPARWPRCSTAATARTSLRWSSPRRPTSAAC